MNKTLALIASGTLLLAACGSSDSAANDTAVSDTVGSNTAGSGTETVVTEAVEVGEADAEESAESADAADADDVGDGAVEETVATDASEAATATAEASCEETAGLFAAGPSVNDDLADPESSAVCGGDTIVVTSNGIPDYTYVQTSPGTPDAADLEYIIPATPELAADVTAVPLLGAAAVSLTGVPIYGPTEGTGGDVLSLVGALSECGSHNGPTGFHIHIVSASENTDCLFTPAEVAESPQLVGYAFDGFPIYTGNDQYTSSWELTDESLFATDTWAAHSFVEGSGDLDECNGLTDADGNYAYYTTDSFPYVLGCYSGEVELAEGAGGDGGPPGDGEGPPAGDDG